MLEKNNLSRNLYMLKGPLAQRGYDWWWHNFTGYHKETGEPKSFFIEYFVCNPALGGEEAVLGQLPFNQQNGIRPSYAMIKVGTWGKKSKQIHNFYPISQFIYSKDTLDIQIGSCKLTEYAMSGTCSLSAKEVDNHPEYMSDCGEMSWNLTIDKQITYNVGYGASKFFRAINAFEMFWHAQGIKTEYSGKVVLDGEVYNIIPEKSYGYADKNWGGDFTSPWLWISSCNMKSLISGKTLNNSVVEFGGGRPKVFGLSLDRKLLGCFYYEGKMYEYNFSKIWTRSQIKFRFKEGGNVNIWEVIAYNQDSVMKLRLKCPVDEMLLINYEAPNGKKLHNKLWNGGTGYGEIKLYQKKGRENILIDHIKFKNTGCEYGEYDTK